MNKKVLAALLAALLLAGCAAQPDMQSQESSKDDTTVSDITTTTPTDDTATTPSSSNTTTITSSSNTTTQTTPTPPATSVASDRLVLSKAGEPTEYQYIYDYYATAAVKEAIEAMRESITTKLPKSSPFIISDRIAIEEPLEVLIGQTGRPESVALQARLTNGHKFAFKAYKNGRVAICATSDDMLIEAIKCFEQTYLDAKKGEFAVPKDLDYIYEKSAKWRLSGVPEYVGGTRSTDVYNGGGGVNMGGDTLSCMQVVSDTNRKQFNTYLTTLKKEGYTEISRNEQLDNIYVQYQNAAKTRLVYAYYIGSMNEARIIKDTASIAETDFEYVCANGNVSIYQYALMYNRNGNGGGEGTDPYPNCGMFYIIRLADNRLILIDGGSPIQATAEVRRELLSFMREITGKKKNECVDIACWYITHYHPDHTAFFEHLVGSSAKNQVNLERVMYNLPDGRLSSVGQNLVQKYPNVKFIKPHTGQNITLGNIDIDVLFTHEDYADPLTGKSLIHDENNTSTVLRLHMNGKTMVLSGDWGGGDTVAPPEYAEGIVRMLNMHTNDNESYLKSDILQVSHHALNPYMSIYNQEIAPDYAFVPQADVKADMQSHYYVVKPNVDQVIKAGCNPDHIYFASRYTYCLHIAQNGNITVAAENIRGSDTGDNPNTGIVEQDYMNVTLKAYEAYRIPTAKEFANWGTIHK